MAVTKSKNAKKYSIIAFILLFFTKFLIADPKAAQGDIDKGHIINAIVALVICPLSISPWAAFGSAIRNLVKNNKIKALIEYFLAVLLLITAIIIVLQ